MLVRSTSFHFISTFLMEILLAPFLVNVAPGSAGLQSKVFFIWGTTCFCCIIFTYFCIPEVGIPYILNQRFLTSFNINRPKVSHSSRSMSCIRTPFLINHWHTADNSLRMRVVRRTQKLWTTVTRTRRSKPSPPYVNVATFAGCDRPLSPDSLDMIPADVNILHTTCWTHDTSTTVMLRFVLYPPTTQGH